MNKEQHTAGRLELAKHGAIVGGPVRKFANGYGQSQIVMCTGAGTVSGSHEEVLANARRIVACWNACEGVPTEALERSDVIDAIAKATGSTS